MKDFNFVEQRSMSDTDAARRLIERNLKRLFPEALSVHRAAHRNDMLGADFVLEFDHMQCRSVDAKVRRKDYGAIGQPDICLEIWSNVERKVPGWALDDSKLGDYVLFTWLDTERATVFDLRILRAVVKSNLAEWQRSYRAAQQRTVNPSSSYTSSVIYVPGCELQEAVTAWQAGKFAGSMVPA